LHVLGAPPAFVLSQDQTLSFILVPAGTTRPRHPVSRKGHRHQVRPAPAGGPTASRARLFPNLRSNHRSAPSPGKTPSKADKPQAQTPPTPRPDAPSPKRQTQPPARPDPGPASTQKCSWATANQPPPTHPFPTSTLPKNGRNPESRALANETDPVGRRAHARRFRRVTPRGAAQNRLFSPAADRDQAPFRSVRESRR
jgi:hypothetical protein